MSSPTVALASRVTIRGALITLPKVATAPVPFGATFPVQLASVNHVPAESTFHDEVVALALTINCSAVAVCTSE